MIYFYLPIIGMCFLLVSLFFKEKLACILILISLILIVLTFNELHHTKVNRYERFKEEGPVEITWYIEETEQELRLSKSILSSSVVFLVILALSFSRFFMGRCSCSAPN